jgi:hypothetical protein
MTRGLRESFVSVACFGGVLAALVSVDPRVRERVWAVVSDPSSGAVTPLGDRLSELFGAIWLAAKYHSIENAPLLIFAVIGAVLVIFMLRS